MALRERLKARRIPRSAAAVGGVALGGNLVTAQESRAVSADGVAELTALLNTRTGRHSLDGRDVEGEPKKTKPRKVEVHTPTSSGLVERKMTSPRMREQISQLVFVGESVLAISSVVDDEGKKLESALSLLPIGKQAEAEGGPTGLSSRTLLRMDPKVALAPRPDVGAIVAWEEAHIGRDDIKAAYGIDDNRISGKHLKVAIGADSSGWVDISDQGSLNGIEVVDLNDLMQQPQDSDMLKKALGVVDFLQEHPMAWSREYADMQVVQPH